MTLEGPPSPSLLRRVTLEALVIVGSILLAFGIDAAWEERREARAGARLLETLAGELAELRAEMVRHRDRWAEVQDATERLIVAQSTGEVPPPAVMDTLLFRFLTPTTFDAQGLGLASATSGGSLGLIQDPELRNMIAAWPGYVAEVRDNELAGRELILRVLTPFFSELQIPLGRSRALLADVVRQERAEGSDDSPGAPTRWIAPLPDDEAMAVAYARLLGDPSFEPLLVTRHQWINVAEYDGTIAYLDRLAARIEDARGAP